MSSKGFELLKISSGELQAGQPAPWAVCDAKGQELLKKGALVPSEDFLRLLEQVGYFAREVVAGPVRQPVTFKGRVNPFAEFDDLCLQLESLFADLETRRQLSPGSVKRRIQDIIVNLQGLVRYDADALMGAVHLSDRFEYHVHHPMQIAVLTELILERLKVPQDVRLSTLSAALTSNLAMNPYQKALNQQKGPLSDAQRKMINTHPLMSANKLRQSGVDDELWIELVEQHHEKVDGTGYPRGLRGNQIRHEALVLALADVYSAMVTPRVYRGPLKLTESLKDLFIQRGSSFDDKLTRIFINELGLYPPGIYVRLNNGELAVVVGRSSDFKAPFVASIKKPDGNMHPSPRRRNSGEEEFGIRHVCDPTDRVRVDPSQLWGFDALRVNIKVDLSNVDPFIRGLR
ncbi:HD-GYP domain-containing protein [Marinospirillum alkaliphilum]|uniref:HD-GYP domain, c-di-GMP phosphodiesterase class II (Or its inactivated variant) n=1 Tax=Marinospirillum alkaliphilum DSM 21637 TaxID=1122209 RepID=A0A1K1TH84_9GAMM|nr:HD domain-containing phosphohydrolase [Marinospirillum alkaliphilum]SFW99645.1 HD-GYP domain, c-di-GMP phosphodiesterase class II (or its inactivated variant) [Marinospirillum alkaliphilum DSM 21637]